MTDTAPQPIVQIVVQRAEGDCAIAALAMFLGFSYEDVLAAAVTREKTRTTPKVHRRGMFTSEIVKTAKRLGVALRSTSKFDPETANGLLGLVPLDDTQPEHIVLLREGLIFDTDGCCWEPDVFYAHYRYVPTDIIVRRET
jgi:ABC-type bacteriocin/lantibiotic exporter with double-glycine peptidase domain